MDYKANRFFYKVTFQVHKITPGLQRQDEKILSAELVSTAKPLQGSRIWSSALRNRYGFEMKQLCKTGSAIMAGSLTLASPLCLKLLILHKYIRHNEQIT